MGKLVPYTVDITTLSPLHRKLREAAERGTSRRVKRYLDQHRIAYGRPPLWFLPRERQPQG